MTVHVTVLMHDDSGYACIETGRYTYKVLVASNALWGLAGPMEALS